MAAGMLTRKEGAVTNGTSGRATVGIMQRGGPMLARLSEMDFELCAAWVVASSTPRKS